MRIPFAALLALLVSHAAFAEAPTLERAPTKTPVRGLYWEVHGKDGGTAYLLGSIHMLDDSVYPLPAQIEKAFKSSSALAVEANVAADPATMAQIQQSMMAAAAYPQGQTLQQHVSKKTYDAVAKRGEGLPLGMAQLNAFKPWFVAMMLEIFAAQKAGLNAELGLDMHFLKKAKSKKIVELEGMEFQIKMFDHLPADQQEGMLYSTAIDMDDFEASIHDMVDAWRRGDADGLNALVHKDEEKDPSLKPVMDALLTKRNTGMADKIGKLIDSGQTAFVVVGAGHFVGPQGIVQLLKNKGYSVQQK